MKQILISFLIIFSTTSISQHPTDFDDAKHTLYTKIYSNYGKTFYVECDWKFKKINLESCGLGEYFQGNDRAYRVEAEHVIPASWFYKKDGVFRQCYLDAKAKKSNKRNFCRRHDEDYRNAHNDLYNLRPSVGAVNLIRSNKPFAEEQSGGKFKDVYGDKIFLSSTRTVVPNKTIRGDIARIAFYMEDRYGVSYSKRQKSLFIKWNKEDPVSPEELALNRKIAKIQGNINKFVE